MKNINHISSCKQQSGAPSQSLSTKIDLRYREDMPVLGVQAAGRVPGVADMIMKHIDMHTIIFTDKCNGEFEVQSNYLNALFTKASCHLTAISALTYFLKMSPLSIIHYQD